MIPPTNHLHHLLARLTCRWVQATDLTEHTEFCHQLKQRPDAGITHFTSTKLSCTKRSMPFQLKSENIYSAYRLHNYIEYVEYSMLHTLWTRYHLYSNLDTTRPYTTRHCMHHNNDKMHKSYIAFRPHGSVTWLWFNINISTYQYKKYLCGDRRSYLHSGTSYINKMTCSYWICFLVSTMEILSYIDAI